ncbi:unnamed protein product [Discosporangium mesarthrocarpum]
MSGGAPWAQRQGQGQGKRGKDGIAGGSTLLRYKHLMIPGQVYRISKCERLVKEPRPDLAQAGAGAGAGGREEEEEEKEEGEVVEDEGDAGFRAGTMEYWADRAGEAELSRLLFVDTGIVDHLPTTYEGALHGLYGEGQPGSEDALT